MFKRVGVLFSIIFSFGVCSGEFDSIGELIEKGELIKATEELLKKEKINPNHSPIKKRLAQIYLKRQLYLKAEKKINYLLALSQSTDHLYLLAKMHLLKGEIDKCEKVCYQILARDRNYISGLLLLAEVHTTKKHYDLANSTYQDISLIAPNDRNFLLQYTLYLIELNRLKKAKENLRTLNKLFKEDHGFLYVSSLYHFKQQESDLALYFIQKALFYKPHHPDYQKLLFDIYLQTKNYPSAIEWLKEKEKNQASDWLYFKLAYYQFIKEGPDGFKIDTSKNPSVYKNILANLERAINKNSQNEYVRFFTEYFVLANTSIKHSDRKIHANYHRGRGSFLESSGQYDLANYHYLRSIKFTPENLNLRQSYANFLKQIGRRHDYYTQLEVIRKFTLNQSFDLDAEMAIVNRQLGKSLTRKEGIDINILEPNRKKIAIVPDIKVEGDETEKNLLYGKKNVLAFSGDFLKYSKQFDVVPFTKSATSNVSDYHITMKFKYESNVYIEFKIYDTSTKLVLTNNRFVRKGEFALANTLKAFKDFLEEFIPRQGQIIKKTTRSIIIDLGTINHLSLNQNINIQNRSDPLKHYLAKIKEADEYVSKIELMDERELYFIQLGDIIFLTNS